MLTAKGYFNTQFMLGYSYKLSSFSKFSLSSSFAPSSLGLEFRYTRLNFKIRLPINLSTSFDQKVIMFSLGLTGLSFFGTYLYDKWRRGSKKYLEKLERKHRGRLSEGRKEFNDLVSTLYGESNNIINKEILHKGVIALKAYYGHPDEIKDIYLKELHKSRYRLCFKAEKSPSALLEEDLQEFEQFPQPDYKEILDVRVLVQTLVTNSSLKFTLADFMKVKGLYNPCLDDSIRPHMFIKIYVNDKVILKYLDKPSNKVDISRDADEYMGAYQVETRGSLSTWLKAKFM